MPEKTELTRRCAIAGLLLWPVALRAHDGHSASRVTAEAKVLAVKDRVVTLRIELLNTGSNPVKLLGVATDQAAKVVLPRPVAVGGFDAAAVSVDFQFVTEVSGVFAVNLDFGEHGTSTVLATP